MNADSTPPHLARTLLFILGAMFLVLAIVFNELLLGWIDPDPPLYETTIAAIRQTQLIFLLTGFSLLLIHYTVGRIPALRSFTRRKLVINLLAATLPLIAFIFTLELLLKPFVNPESQRSEIYIPDETFGWKLSPGSEGDWGGVSVKINNKGLRGPERAYTKPNHTQRILFLGDSVTMGYKLAQYEDTFPHLVEKMLAEQYTFPVEAINGGVSGYSPWQEYLFLSEEGIRYSPDLIILTFVLNDVTEKYGLTKFGGPGLTGEINQEILGDSQSFLGKSSILYAAQWLVYRLRFGSNLSEGAQEQELLDVTSLVKEPERQDARAAWESTLNDLEDIVDFSTRQQIPIVLVILPYKFQLTEPGLKPVPQQILRDFALEQNIPFIDFLPIFAVEMETMGRSAEALLIDQNHLSQQGNQIVAAFLSGYIQNENLLKDGEEIQ